MARHPRPLAIGLLHSADHASQVQRTRARIALTLKADHEGYALLETIETNGSALGDELAYRALDELATRFDAHAVVTSGAVDLGRVEEIAERVRMMVIAV